MSMLALITLTSQLVAHEISPAIADVTLSDDAVELSIRLTAEPLIAGIDLQGLQDTNDAPDADKYDAARALPPNLLADEFKAAWPSIAQGFTVLAGDTPIALDLQNVDVVFQPNTELPRDTNVTLRGALPTDGSDLRIGWQAANGPIIVRQSGGGDDAYAGYLENGALSEPLPRAGAATESAVSVFIRYIGVGFDHIIPKGLDHILFVLLLLLVDPRSTRL